MKFSEVIDWIFISEILEDEAPEFNSFYIVASETRHVLIANFATHNLLCCVFHTNYKSGGSVIMQG